MLVVVTLRFYLCNLESKVRVVHNGIIAGPNSDEDGIEACPVVLENIWLAIHYQPVFVLQQVEVEVHGSELVLQLILEANAVSGIVWVKVGESRYLGLVIYELVEIPIGSVPCKL